MISIDRCREVAVSTHDQTACKTFRELLLVLTSRPVARCRTLSRGAPSSMAVKLGRWPGPIFSTCSSRLGYNQTDLQYHAKRCGHWVRLRELLVKLELEKCDLIWEKSGLTSLNMWRILVVHSVSTWYTQARGRGHGSNWQRMTVMSGSSICNSRSPRKKQLEIRCEISIHTASQVPACKFDHLLP